MIRLEEMCVRKVYIDERHTQILLFQPLKLRKSLEIGTHTERMCVVEIHVEKTDLSIFK